MMKKATWKKLFTRNKSKSRDKNKEEVACNLCVGMPLGDTTTLCDKHRNLRAQSGNNISLEHNAIRDAAVETQKPPSILKSASPTTVVKPAVEQSVESTAPVQVATPEITETLRLIADECTSKKDVVETVVEAHQDGTVTNEEFMTEEVDSPNLSENSRTENTVPIVIEPQEPNEENRVIEEDGSNIKSAVSHTLLPSDNKCENGQNDGVEGVVTISDLVTVQDEQDRPQPVSSYRAHIGSRKAIANLVWFGTANGPEKSSWEIPDDMNGECSFLAALDKQPAASTNGSSNDASEQSSELPESMQNQRVTSTSQNSGAMQDQQVSSALNPTLAEPTPLSTRVPNDYLNAPLNPQTQVDSCRVLDGGVDVTTALGSENHNESSEGSNYDSQERGDEDDDDDDDQNIDEGFDEDEDGYVSDADDSADAQQAYAPSTNQPESIDMTFNAPHSAPSSPENQQSHDGNAPRMVFGTLTSEFSAQPLFFSPNFGIQGMGPVSSGNAQDNMMGEDVQYPNFSIFGMMKDFLPPSAFELQEGRVTEITELTESNRQVEESSNPLGQSPPSLEDEDEFDRNARRREAAEEGKELRKE